MGQTAATQSTFNPVPHLIGIGVLGAANPLIYFSSDPIAAWLIPIGSVALLVGLIYAGYRLLAPARAKASGIKPFVMLAWVLAALATFQAWTDKPSTRSSASSSVNQTAPTHSTPSNNGLQPFNGELDQEVQFDPSTARPIQWPPAEDRHFDPSTARPVQN